MLNLHVKLCSKWAADDQSLEIVTNLVRLEKLIMPAVMGQEQQEIIS